MEKRNADFERVIIAESFVNSIMTKLAATIT